jgi:D-alanyl-D-alanine endopeptidase (penicillin-binding protein 7)
VTLPESKRTLNFVNTNALVRNSDWKIGLSKTGYINEAGKCLVMQAMIANQPIVIVLLDSWGRLTRIGDANRIRKWLEKNPTKLISTPLRAG